ncbi:uncharacterized protein K460DRAFT_111474 [Cucurbitaria berberidis CBS 394.84]|uniref:Uncharacterized protein n=1 Tax=Cucurbitaria berberidis CBS 394.84 TaxID=1168544 RepID=A0A9P4GHC8_9PLEO|nr:uncharacterized protein K460DRAFT_111474 [Cucurbitaria berberidis CBS 394.84]KAF1845595.1 hypothetical protein K460DRAFT_111474 [Cucurbitaria berberidis CBS 394.84]
MIKKIEFVDLSKEFTCARPFIQPSRYSPNNCGYHNPPTVYLTHLLEDAWPTKPFHKLPSKHRSSGTDKTETFYRGTNSSHDAERPSRSSSRASYQGEEDSEDTSCNLPISSLPFRIIYSAATLSMPNPERNRYSNKESAKVNAGLECGSGAISGCIPKESNAMLTTNTPALNIDFGQLMVSSITPEPRLDTKEQVHCMLHPPPYAFVHGVLSIQWVRGAVGEDHFVFRESDERYVLSRASQLRLRGAALGIPMLYMEWLCGNSEAVSSTEAGMYLTPELFEEIQREELDIQVYPE